MNQLSRVWSEVWRELPDEVHAKLTKVKGDLQLPSDRAVRAFFPRAFSEPEIPPRFRNNKEISGSRETPDEVAHAIAAAVRRETVRLVRTTRHHAVLDRRATQAAMSANSKKEPLLSLAYDLSHDYGEIDDDVADAALRDRFFPAASIEGVRATLAEQGNVLELQGALGALTACEVGVELGVEEPEDLATLRADAQLAWQLERSRVLAEAMGDLPAKLSDFLALYAPSDEAESRTPDEAWERILEHPGLDFWHLRARQLSLSTAYRPSVPALRKYDGPAPRSLDLSIEARVMAALDVQRELRSNLPNELAMLHREIGRSAAALGLLEAGSRAVIALGGFVMSQLTTPPSMPGRSSKRFARPVLGSGSATHELVDRVQRTFAKFELEANDRAGLASLPGVMLNAFEDPAPWYMASLWRRVHGFESRGQTQATTDVWDLLTGIALTAGGRITTDAFRDGMRMSSSDVSLLDREVVAVAEGIDPTEQGIEDSLEVLALTVEHIRAGCPELPALFTGDEVQLDRLGEQWTELTSELPVAASYASFVRFVRMHQQE